MANVKQKVGSWGEEAASQILEYFGFQILNRNVRVGKGEIDIVSLHEKQLVFVEVKTRTNRVFGAGEEAVTKQKMLRLAKSCYRYLEEIGLEDDNFRIDVVVIEEVFDHFFLFRHWAGVGEEIADLLDGFSGKQVR